MADHSPAPARHVMMPPPLEQLLQSAVNHHQAGQLGEAEKLYTQVLEHHPNHPDALHLLGVIAGQKGATEDALAFFDQAIAVAPQLATIHFNKANTLRDCGRTAEAQACYETALKHDPAYQDALLNLGALLKDLGQPEAAAKHFMTLTKSAPSNPKAHYNLAKCFQDIGLLDEAREALKTALHISEKDPDTHFAIANVYAEQKQYDQAISHINTAINLKPKWPEAYANKANYLAAIDRNDEALKAYDTSLALDPNNTNTKVNRGLLLLTLGHLEAGWEAYQERRESKSPFHKKLGGTIPIWRNQDLAGKSVLVINEQGLGDEILFSSLLEELANTAQSITFICSDKLKTVFRRSFAHIKNLTLTSDKEFKPAEDDIDFQMSLLDLGAIFRPRISSFKGTPYLIGDQEKSRHIRGHLKQRFPSAQHLVGLSWASANPYIGDDKSIPLKLWHPVLSLSSIQYICAQYGDSAADIRHLPTDLKASIATIENIDLSGDLDDTLSLLGALDLLVTCSNTTAHLAAAAGIPVLVLVPSGRARIWYWFLESEHSPWYKSAKIMRQATGLGWQPTVDKVADYLVSGCFLDKLGSDQ